MDYIIVAASAVSIAGSTNRPYSFNMKKWYIILQSYNAFKTTQLQEKWEPRNK